MITNLKGSIEFTSGNIGKIVVGFIVVAILMYFTYSKFQGSVDVVNEENKIHNECAQWASQPIPFDESLYKKENYPGLYSKFKNDYAKAKRYCKNLKVGS